MLVCLSRWVVLSGVLVLGAVGCDDLKQFEGSRNGSIVGGNFVRSCFGVETKLTLQFDPDLTTPVQPDASPPPQPNTITTDDGTFQSTPLDPISQLPNDQLSLFDFPGPQRLRNYLLLARPSSGPLAGRDALVVVSLLASDDLEVRVIARSADGVTSCPSDLEVTDAGVVPLGQSATRREYFGFWRLKKD